MAARMNSSSILTGTLAPVTFDVSTLASMKRSASGCLIAVSYTHLDVYKRQQTMRRTKAMLMGDLLEEFFARPYVAAKVAEGRLPDTWREVVAVSYTHLDVYKRQAWPHSWAATAAAATLREA